MKANGNGTRPKNDRPATPARTNGSAVGPAVQPVVEPLEWDRLRQRLSTLDPCSEFPVEMEETLSSAAIERVWAQRAAQMATSQAAEDASEQVEVAVLQVGRERMAVAVEWIREIRQGEPVTRVPRVPAWVVGVLNLRGAILSVIDLRLFLGLPEAASGSQPAPGSQPAVGGQPAAGDQSKDLLVVVATRDMEVVLRVSDVPGIVPVRAREIYQAPGLLRSLRPEWVRGIFDARGSGSGRAEPVILLNLEALLSDRRLIIHDEPA